MSQDNGHFFVSGTKIEVLGIQSRTSSVSALHGLMYTHPSMAAYLPCLPGSPCISTGVLTSFVPPVHNQGVSLAPLQGPALWKIFLPTTGSFFVISLTVLHGYRAGTLRWTFRPACSTCLPAFPVMTGLSSRRRLPEAQSSRGRVLSVLIPAVMQPVPAAS